MQQARSTSPRTWPINDNDILIDEALQLLLPDVPSQSRILDFLREVFPRQPVLPVVVRVEVVENLPGLRFGEHGFLFVGGAVDVCAGPEQRDFVRPELFQ